tara:strand:+ start:946 stop:1620 length:675 start_codon:yes stop_codon:yes gene_type:complete
MRIYRLIFLRELKKVFSYKANYIFSLMFYSAIIFLVSIGLQGQNSVLTNVAPGLIWVAIILVLFLSFEDIFHDDYYDGTLDIYLIEDITFYGYALIKSFSHWLANCLPMIIVTPIIGIFVNLNSEIIIPMMVTLIIGTPALSFIGCMGSSLILSLKIHGLIMPIIILPLFLPILVFGVGALDVLIFNGFEELFLRQLALLAGVSGLSIAFCPIASAYIIKTNYD